MPATPTRRDALRAERLEDRTTPVSFGQPTGYDAGGAGMGIATGDFDGDGRPDAVVSSSGGVTTYLNGGGGTMTNATDLGLGVGFPRTVRVADLTGDGRLDIIAGADMSRAVAILPGNGDGTFRAPVVVAIGSPREVQGIAVADFDGDGRLDVAASTGDGVTVLLNDGSAAVLGAAPVVYPVGVDGTGRELAAADFTGDGRPDIALAVDGPDNQVAVFTNSGTGTFAAGQTVPTGIGSGPRTVLATTAAGAPLDLNGDGHTDLAVGYTGNGFVGLLLGNGDGTFRPPNTFTTGHPSVGRLVAADVDGDGHLDLVPVVGDGGATVGQQPVLLGDGAGNLAPPAQITIVGDTDMAAADLDGDGLVDLLGGGWFGLAVSLNTTRTLASFGVAAAAAATAGEGLSVTVTARNPAGEVLTGYAGTVHFTSDDPGAVLPADYTFVPSDNGVHVFTGAVLKTAGSRTVTAAGPGGTATGTATVLVSPAAAAAFALTDYPAAVAAGDPKHLTVTAYDAFGNVTTGYTGTVRFTATDPQVTAGAGLPADYTFQAADNGQHTFAGVVLKTAGTRSVTAADAADPTITGTRGGVAVGPGARAAVAAVSGGGQAATVGTDFVTPVVARVTDAFGNPVPDVAVFFPGPAAGPGADFGGGLVLVTDAAGRASVTPTANTAAGGYTVSVTASGVPGAAAFALHNTPGDPAAVVAVSGGGQTATAGADFPTPLAVRVTDAFGNPVPGTAVTFSGPAAGPGPDFPAGATTTTDADGRAG
ncbi:MAG: FG-GAP-like repeat-containing protein, partial [Gemmataceae bacterium]|nr:FG-GAP-like repeat-containing protein [Gemmataceae bacterium]